MLGAVTYFNDWAGGWVFLPGALLFACMFFGWFYTVIGENQHGIFNLPGGPLVPHGNDVVHLLRGDVLRRLLRRAVLRAHALGAVARRRGRQDLHEHPAVAALRGTWPTNGPGHVGGHADGTFETIPAFGLPAINTAILLTSGVTVTIAHHALRAGKRGVLKLFLALTFILGFSFVGAAGPRVRRSLPGAGAEATTGIYGSTFFMLTGFHGLHVTIGAIMLHVIWLRVLRGHFTPKKHFAFEAVSWYWHFVDVVWLGLFVFVYWL